MSDLQLGLLQGPALSSYRGQLERALDDELTAICLTAHQHPGTSSWDLEAQLATVRFLADGLRSLDRDGDDVPF